MDERPDGPAHGRPLREERPEHPTRQAAFLLVGVTLLIVVLAFLSASGRL
jgi:hypothetical protein